MIQYNKLFYQAILASLLMIFAGPAFAKREGKHLERMTKELGLSTEQQEKVKALQDKDGQQIKNQRQLMHAAHKDLEQTLKSPATDEEIRAKFSQLEKAQAEFSKLRFEKVLAIRAILTPEQRLNFKGMGKEGGFKHHKKDR